MADVVTFNPLALRRSVMQGQKTSSGANGWKKTVYTATDDTLEGNTTTAAILSAVPSGFRYAVAIADDISNPEPNTFIGCIFIPSSSVVFGFRWRYSTYNPVVNMESGQFDVILRSGTSVTIWTRDEPLNDEVPATGWDYYCLKPGAATTADELSSAFASIGTYNAMLSVADRDYNTAPEVDNTYCESITINSGSFSGSYIRYRGGSYAYGSNWGSAYNMITDNDTRIACFYI